MGRSVSPSSTTPLSSSRYVSWDEVAVYSDGESKEIHYYLTKSDGRKRLAVVGKENMPYRCVLRRRSMVGLADPSSATKRLRNREDVIGWLNFVVSGPQCRDHHVDVRLLSNSDEESCMQPLRDSQSLKPKNSSEGFLWLGLPSTCRKMRRHYPSFQRRGVKISVHDFVYVLSEEYKRLVAYIEDMYEDSIGNKMVAVRWFHKVDEVGLVLTRSFSDKEIFFSLSLQDLNIECIDGIATVLGPYHFEKYMNEVGSSHMEPFVCHELFDDDEIKPFDITRVKGYWNQQLLKQMFPSVPPKHHLKPRPYEPPEEVNQKINQDSTGIIPRKKRRLLLPNTAEEPCNSNEGSAAARSEKQVKENACLLSVGCAVEVLSQDSGIRGCWFRASIMKVSKNKVKVRYQDIIDVTDEAKYLEEWVAASRLASSDEFGLRFNGRRTIRPLLRGNVDNSSHAIGVGTVVDARWCDGWWEGIVVREEHGDRFHVFFPGEKRESVFPLKDLRHSHEWIDNGWVLMRERPEVVTSIVHLLQKKRVGEANSGNNEAGLLEPDSDVKVAIVDYSQSVGDTRKDISPAIPNWNSRRKRSYRREKVLRKEHQDTEEASLKDIKKCLFDEVLTHPSTKVDREKCKVVGVSIFNRSRVPHTSSLVMSR